MRRFIVKLTLITILFIVIDKVFLLIEKKAPSLEYDRRLEYCLDGKLNYDIVIFGSSRSARAILAEEFKPQTGLDAYNLSYHGTNLDFHEFLMRTYLKYNERPKLIILGVDDYNSFLRSNTTFRADRLYSLTKYPEIRDELVARKEKIPFLSDLLVSHRINRKSLFLQKVEPTALNKMTSNGSMPSDSVSEKFINDTIPYASRGIDYPKNTESWLLIHKYLLILKICAAENIPLLVVPPPNFYPYTPVFRQILEKYTRNQARIYYYNELNETYKNKLYYVDQEHLNSTGATIFTHELLDFIVFNYPQILNAD